MLFKSLGFTAQNKIKTTTLVFSVLCLILLTNIQERMMIKRLNETVTSIYEDRVVVGNYILQLSNHFEEITQLLKSGNRESPNKLNSLLAEIDSINIEYDKTYLTETEKVNFKKFTAYSIQIKNSIQSNNTAEALSASLEAEKILKVLSSIQVEEGKEKLDEVLGMTNTRSILSYLEIVIIIVISILIQKIILSTKPLIVNKTKDTHHLN
ncbi:MCP four helix bundle domain-containing protein [Sphingobacterium composti Ten et al. 2007 non Yoo et al. 2007]|uniref:MCP four helix bundle domain-containing protein n=1 Tax=Sphingobacterium composti TaxID=363260 RepID=UPI00135B12DC|nr:MCP four helix bundle domain-containing protein [Sphingobacterium composti Ten et al. 2007 non Yoo et al. 2007]